MDNYLYLLFQKMCFKIVIGKMCLGYNLVLFLPGFLVPKVD